MRIPIEVVSGIILIHVSVNEINGYMAFDTGAMKTCLNKFYFPDFVGKDIAVSKFDNEMKTASAVDSDITAVMHNIDDIKLKVSVSGVIGYQVLKNHLSFFDFQHEKIGIK